MKLGLASALALTSFLTIAGCSSDDNDSSNNTEGQTTIVVALSPLEEVPPVTTATGATGEANIVVDTTTGAISGSVSVSGLTGQADRAHVHTGVAGTNGSVLITLVGNDTGTLWSIPENEVLDAPALASLASAELYINVHTPSNQGGEVRGQIVTSDGDVVVIRSALSGDNEVPPVTTAATGTGVITLNKTTGAASATVITSGVTNADAAHIHAAARDDNGGIVTGLDQDTDNSNIWRLPAGTILQAEDLTNFNAGGLYFNVHSPDSRSGLIRGQIQP